jgi:hypothetical protein
MGGIVHRRHRVAASMLVAALAFSMAACGHDSSDSSTPAPTGGSGATTPPSPLPPDNFEELALVFDPMLEPIGLRLTRGALIDRTGGGYEESDTGTHLALYVEPIDESTYTTADYVAGVYDVAALVTPYVFDQWTDLETYDICQEPPNSVDDGPEPFPESQIEVARPFGEGFNWEDGDLTDLLREEQGTDELRIIVSRNVMQDPDYKAARQAARESTETTPPSPPTTG